LLKIGQSKPNIVFDSDRKKMMASLERNPERNGRRRRTREKLTLLSGLIQLRLKPSDIAVHSPAPRNSMPNSEPTNDPHTVIDFRARHDSYRAGEKARNRKTTARTELGGLNSMKND
jgi:hypothetical protein